VNGDYYRNVILKEMLLPDICHVAGNCFVFQQHSVPAHRARDTMALLQKETPDFIPPDLWLPNSPDLNPVDYCVWSILQEKVNGTRFANIDELKCKLLWEWAKLDHEIIASATSLRACVTSDRGHFEQAF